MQRGLQSSLQDVGRYSVRRENGDHQFHLMLARALRAGLNEWAPRGDPVERLLAQAPATARPARSPAGLEARVEGHATVDEEGRARQVVGIVGREPHGGATDVVGLPDALVGDE